MVNFIRVINTKSFVVSPGHGRYKQWSPSELVEDFEKLIGDKQKISNTEKHGLHPLIEKEIEYWMWQTDNKRDYNLNLLV